MTLVVNLLIFHDFAIGSLSQFSPLSRLVGYFCRAGLASASADNTIKLWSRAGEELATLTGHDDNVNSVCFNSDGNTLASASDDNKVILWNFNFNDLFERSCHWLNDYLATNPQVLEELKECKVK